MSVAIAGPGVNDAQKRIADLLLSSTGLCEWLEDEALLDAVTALSGSGPAYVYYLIEAMAEAGRKTGLKADLAMKLARQTVIGAAALAEEESDTGAGDLRYGITSPGGTTEAALKVLMDGRMQSLFDDALLAAKKRGSDLNR
jgi:pyrroline-5-carboxylate reductase